MPLVDPQFSTNKNCYWLSTFTEKKLIKYESCTALRMILIKAFVKAPATFQWPWSYVIEDKIKLWMYA